MSVQQTTGDLTSPSTFMNNTHTGLFTPTDQHSAQQQTGHQQPGGLGVKQEGLDGSSNQLNSMQQQHQQQHQHQQHGAGDVMMPPASGADAAAEFGRSSMMESLGDLHEHDVLHHGGEGLGSHPLMLGTADSLLSQGSTDLCGLGDAFDVDGVQHQHQHGSSFGAAAAASRISIDMQDVLNTDCGLPSASPQLHTGSHSPGLSHFGGGGGHTAALPHSNDSYTGDSLKTQQQNGTHFSALVPQQMPQQVQQQVQQQQQQQQQQQHMAATQQQYQRQSQAQQRQQYNSSRAGSSAAAAAAAGGVGGGDAPQQPVFRSQYRGVSYDKKKRKWRVQIKVAALGKSGVSVGYFDTEDAAARAYDRAAIGLLGRQNCKAVLNFPIEEYDNDSVPELVGKSREEVKATLKSERAKLPRRRLTHRRRTSRFLGVGSSNRKNQWQARILYHGKVTHLGYYRTEEEAARVYDKVSISLHGAGAQTNFPIDQYKHEVGSLQQKLSGLTREELQRALGVKPMDKSSRYRGVSKKKGRWEAKVMLNRKWAYREMFDTEAEAARAYDAALWRLKPREARNYANFKDTCPPDVADVLASLEKDTPLALHPTGLPLTAKPLIDAGLLFDDEGQSIRAPNGLTRSVSIGDLISVGDSAGQSVSEEPSAERGSGRTPVSGDGASGGVAGAVAGAAEGISSLAGPAAAGAGLAGGPGGMVKSASYSALSGLDGAVTSSLAAAPANDPAAAAAAPVPLHSLPTSARSGLRGELTHVHLQPMANDPFSQQQQQQQQQHQGSAFGGQPGSSRGLGGLPRVQSVPHLRSYGSDAGSPTLPPMGSGGGGGAGHGGLSAVGPGGSIPGLPAFGSTGYGSHFEQQQWMAGGMAPAQHSQPGTQQQMPAYSQPPMQHSMGIKADSAYWTPELSYPLPDQPSYPQPGQQQPQHSMRVSRSCGNLAFMGSTHAAMAPMGSMPNPGQHMMHSSGHNVHSPPGQLNQPYGSSSGGGSADFASGEHKPLMVRVGSEQHLLNPTPNPSAGFKGMTRIASESRLSSMVPLSPGHQQFLSPERGLMDGPAGQMGPAHEQGFGNMGSSYQHPQQQHPGMHSYGSGYGAAMGGMPPAHAGAHGGQHMQHGQQQQQQPQQHYALPPPQQQQQQHMYQQGGLQQSGGYAHFGSPTAAGSFMQQQGMQQLQPGSLQLGMAGPTGAPGMPPLSPVRQQQQQMSAAAGSSGAAGAGSSMARAFRSSSSGGMQRAHSCAALESIDETSVFRLQPGMSDMDGGGMISQRGHSLPGALGVLPPINAPAATNGAPVTASGVYLAQQQQQQQQPGGMVPTGGAFGAGPSGTMPPISTALPVSQEQQQQQQHQFGQPAMQGSSSMYGMTGPGGAGNPTGTSAAAAAAVFGAMPSNSEKWDVFGSAAAPDSPLGVVQIGGEELDVTMAFLADNSPRHMGDADDALDITGLLTDPDPSSFRPPSPPVNNSTSALLFGGPGADGGTKMVE